MPIILAIEPDRRQRHVLGSLVRHRVGAELILADTTEHALEAIGNRVPDLVLVPALLSPQDDAALAAALRVIAAAAHVRTLTIPVLATETQTEQESGGLLSRWRRGRNSSQTPDGCDPAVFAEQVTAYLAEAAAARAMAHDDDLSADHPLAAASHAGEQAPMAAVEEFVIEETSTISTPAYTPTYTPAETPVYTPVYAPAYTPTYAEPIVREETPMAAVPVYTP